MLIIVGESLAQNPHGDNFQQDCNKCHSSASWEIDQTQFAFNHDTTGFSLTGQHAVVSCKGCHQSLKFSETEQACINCHTDVHNMSVGDDCMRCHTSSNWLVDNIPQLHEQNGFPLFGAHDMLTCLECHQSQNSLQWTRIGNECADCHMTDFKNTTNPNHISSGFSTDCISCHLPTSDLWGGDNFHLFFPLTQGHNINDCNACHSSPTFTDASSECVSCHLSDFNSTTNPNHVAANFSTDCAQCHSTAPGWSPTTFGNGFHDFFPLTKGHDLTDCKACHTTANYADASSDCVSCHLTDFDNTSNPNHKTSGFSQDCALCHTTDPGWSPAQFTDHDSNYFPIYSGRHRGTWQSCTECHLNQGDYTSFSCIDCHAHSNESRVRRQHDGEVRNFVYESDACYRCHPSGRGEGD